MATETFDGASGALAGSWSQLGLGANVNRNGSGAGHGASAGNEAGAIYTGAASTTDQYFKFTIASVAGGGDHFGGGILLRSSGNWYVVQYQATAINLDINRYASSTYNETKVQIDLDTATPLGAGDMFEVEVSINGSGDPVFDIWLTRSGQARVQLDSYTDTTTTTPPAGTSVGVFFYEGSSTQGLTADSWEGGDQGGSVNHYTLTADSGSYAVTGQNATLTQTSLRELDADSGSYAINGTAAALSKGFKLAAAGGSYTITGSDISFQLVLDAPAGSYTVTGTDATLTKSANAYSLAANGGTYSVTGAAAGLAKGFKLSADSGSYAITGQDATLSDLSDYVIVAEAGQYYVQGFDTLTRAIGTSIERSRRLMRM